MTELSHYEVCETCALLRKYAQDLEAKGLTEKADEMRSLYDKLLYSHVYVSPIKYD